MGAPRFTDSTHSTDSIGHKSSLASAKKDEA